MKECGTWTTAIDLQVFRGDLKTRLVKTTFSSVLTQIVVLDIQASCNSAAFDLLRCIAPMRHR